MRFSSSCERSPENARIGTWLVDGKARADEELNAFYGKVLPASQTAARRMTYASLPALARRTNVRYEERRFSVESAPGANPNARLGRLVETESEPSGQLLPARGLHEAALQLFKARLIDQRGFAMRRKDNLRCLARAGQTGAHGEVERNVPEGVPAGLRLAASLFGQGDEARVRHGLREIVHMAMAHEIDPSSPRRRHARRPCWKEPGA